MPQRGQSRRDFLLALGSKAALLPLLPSLGARAQTGTGASGLPRRTLVLFSGIGSVESQLWPATTGAGWSPPAGGILEPLNPVKGDVNLLRNLDRTYRDDGSGGSHERATTDVMTGGNPIPGQLGNWAQYPSVDQIIAQRLKGQGTRFSSLQLAVQPNNNGIYGTCMTRISYAGYNQPLDPIADPSAAFRQIFGDFGVSAAQREQDNKNKLSVLDALSQSFGKLRATVSREDYARVDAHTTALRELEVSLQPGGLGSNCVAPTIDGNIDPSANDNYPALVKTTTDILVAALACDATRVVSLQWSHAFCLLAFRWLGITEQHHTLSHQTDTTSVAQRAAIHRWYVEQFTYLVQALKSVREGDRTLLDNTMVYWATEMADSSVHSVAGSPVITAGRGGGAWKTGQYIDFQSQAYHKQVLCSLLVGQGIVDIPVVGDTYGSDKPGPLAALSGSSP